MPNTQAPVKPPASRPWQAEPLSDVLLELDSSLEGLSELEAARRLAETGPNELNAKPPRTLAQMAREQLTDPMILILLVAAVLSALLQEWAEAGIIFAIVVVNAVIGIVQERKAQSSLEALRSMSAPEARVVRDGVEMVVPARDLVPGDLVQLGDGSMAPADLRLVEAAGLRMQEAALTGESVPVEKDASAVVLPGAPLGDRSNMAFATAIVTAGRGAGIVVATGMGTEVGHIAGMLEGDEELDTPIKRKLASFGKLLTIVGVAAALCLCGVLAGAYAADLTRQAEESKQPDLLVISEPLATGEQAGAAEEKLTSPLDGDTLTVTMPFGNRVHPITGQTTSHDGLDIQAESGAAVYAPRSGQVLEAALNQEYGNYVVIGWDGGEVLFAHLSACAVAEGDQVTQGQNVGYVGQTGMAAGPHLHVEIRLNGELADPETCFTGVTFVH